MFYPRSLQGTANIYRMYCDLALEEYKIGNTRYANILYRRGKKYHPEPSTIPKNLGSLVKLLGTEQNDPDELLNDEERKATLDYSSILT